MEENEFIKELTQRANIANISISKEEAKKFYQYMNLLLEWNEKMNLTAITDPQEIIIKHFIDSLTLLPYIKENQTILDIGTGAGFPGIPLKMMRISQKMTLLDSLQKRITFLQEVISKLSLQKIEAIHGRAEEFAMQKRESYDIIVSRAVAKLNVLLEYMLPFAKVGGKVICMKANEIEEEQKEAEKAIDILGGRIEKIEEVMLPGTDIVRKILIIKKVKNTPKQYPRKAGIPTKKPLV